jgi:crooked neck
VEQDGLNFDSWFDYSRLEEAALQDLKRDGGTEEEVKAAVGRVREIYERAVAHVPPGDEKRHWRRYIFLWLNYALFEEVDVKVRFCIVTFVIFLTQVLQDYGRARQVYQTAVQLVPHKRFTFAKLWALFAQFEIRRLDLGAARKIFGTAIGMCPKEALFKKYIELEIEVKISSCLLSLILTSTCLQLREFDRVRTIYEKYIEVCFFFVHNNLVNPHPLA